MFGIPRARIVLGLLLCGAFLCLSPQAYALTAPGLTQSFSPTTIGLGSESRLTIVVYNWDSVDPVSDVALTDSLPVGLVIASPSNAWTDCVNGVLDASDGATAFSLTGARLVRQSNCTVELDVAGTSIGSHAKSPATVSSDAGIGSSAGATLTVDNRVSITKDFSPSAVKLGEVSRLTYHLDNTRAGGNALGTLLKDNLPDGLRFASPLNLVSDCATSNLSVESGQSALSVQVTVLNAGFACSLSLDVEPVFGGALGSTTEIVTTLSGTVGRAGAVLDVTVPNLELRLAGLVLPGESTELAFTIHNLAREEASSIGFDLDLDAALAGLAPSGALESTPCGVGSALSFVGGVLSFSGGTVAADDACTFSVPLAIPAGAVSGSYALVTSSVEVELGGAPRIWSEGSTGLSVSTGPSLSLAFEPSVVVPGDTVTATLQLDNTDVGTATGITFSWPLVGAFGSISTVTNFCGSGSSAFVQEAFGGPNLVVSVPSLAGEQGCTLQLNIPITDGLNSGEQTLPTGRVKATLGGRVESFPGASAALTFVAPPRLSKTFLDGPVAPGSTVELEYRLGLSESAPDAATGIAFSDDFDLALTGLVATNLPMSDVCGTGSTLSGVDTLTFAGGALAAGEECVFRVALTVPSTAAPGPHGSTTSTLSATSLGRALVGPSVTSSLVVAGLAMGVELMPAAALAGDTVVARFNVENLDSTRALTNLSFSTPLLEALAGLTAPGPLPSEPCGSGSILTGTSTLLLSGGTLPPGASCTFDVELLLPTNALVGEYSLQTGNASATFDSASLVFPGANALLRVVARLGFEKAFSSTTTQVGEPLTLSFTLVNNDPTETATGLAFSDDLGAALTGLVATGLPRMGACGVGSTLSGTEVLSLSGGSLAPGASCTFDVALELPGSVAPGTVISNVTSNLSGNVGALMVSAEPARAEVEVTSIELALAIPEPITAGGRGVVEFQLLNHGGPQSELALGVNLDAALPGLAGQGLPLLQVCGSESMLQGSGGQVSLSKASLDAAGACSFSMVVEVPLGTAPGEYEVQTGYLVVGGLRVASPASATMTVLAPRFPPRFVAEYTPQVVNVGAPTTLTFTIDNSADPVAIDGLTFLASLPSGLKVAEPSLATTTCRSGNIVAVSGSNLIRLSNGKIDDGKDNCRVSVDVVAAAIGDYSHVTTLDTPFGPSAPTTSDLSVISAPTLTLSAAPALVQPGQVTTLTFSLAYPEGLTGDYNDIAFDLDLEAALAGAVAADLPLGAPCGLQSTVSGTSVVSLSGASLLSGESCSFTVDVKVPGGALAGDYPITTSLVSADLDGYAVESPPGEAALSVGGLVVSKSFAPEVVVADQDVVLRYQLSNTDDSREVTEIAFSDNLTDVTSGLASVTGVLPTPCGMDSVLSGTDEVSFSGGSLLPGETCQFDVRLHVPPTAPSGVYSSVTSAIAGQMGGLPLTGRPAAATLTVEAAVHLSKRFLAAAAPGATVPLEFTISNLHPSLAASEIAFSDDLDAALSGLIATTTPSGGDCGSASDLSGVSLLAFRGGALGSGESCTFSTLVQVPEDAALGGLIRNVTEPVSALLGGNRVIGTSATAEAQIGYLRFEGAFQDAGTPGGSVKLSFTIDNRDALQSVSGLGFALDLGIALPGLSADGAGRVDVCGAGSQLAGTNLLVFSGGVLPPSGSCTFDVPIGVPPDAPSGRYQTGSAELALGNGATGLRVQPELLVAAPPALELTFSPLDLFVGGSGELVMVVDNRRNPVPVGALQLDATLPSGLRVGQASTDCGMGTTSASGGVRLLLQDGRVSAGAECQVNFVVEADRAGAFVLGPFTVTSELGESRSGSVALAVAADPQAASDAGVAMPEPTAGADAGDGGNSPADDGPTDDDTTVGPGPSDNGAGSGPDASTGGSRGADDMSGGPRAQVADASTDAGSRVDAGDAGGQDAKRHDKSGCGCSVPGRRAPDHAPLLLACALGLLWTRRRRG